MNDASSRFRIGAVSKLTRIPVDTLRVWERRYAVVAPDREHSPVRLYNQDDVERLLCIKRLVDAGHAIGSIARLPRAELEGMLALHKGPQPSNNDNAQEPICVCCYGEPPTLFDTALTPPEGVTLLGQHRSWPAFEVDVLQRAPEALVIEVAALTPDRVEEILQLCWRSGVTRVIVCYGFAQSALVGRLEAEGAIALQSPVARSQIMRELRRPLRDSPSQPRTTLPAPEPRIFEDEALLEIARRSTSVDCECPHHLAGIIRTLNEFEFYSASCQHRHADDAALHAMLRSITAQARALMERALVEVAALENIPLPKSALNVLGAARS